MWVVCRYFLLYQGQCMCMCHLSRRQGVPTLFFQISECAVNLKKNCTVVYYVTGTVICIKIKYMKYIKKNEFSKTLNCHIPKKKHSNPMAFNFWSQHKNWCHEFFVSHLHWVDLTLNALDTFFRGSQLSLFSGQQLSNL